MKKTIMTLVAVIVAFNLFAQSSDDTSQLKLFQKLVLDVSSIPLSTSIGKNNPELSAHSFTLGYQVAKRFDLRINADLFNLFENEAGNLNEDYVCERLLGMSLGSKIILFKGRQDSFLEKTSLGLVGKFGVGISPKYSEQESFFYDFSLRTYFGKVPYFGLGVTHQMYGSSLKSNLSSFYLSFGLDF